MKVLNLGSLNIDRVYSVEHFARKGETIASTKLEINGGGKGLNQSVALARAGAEVYHAGAIGSDGTFLQTLFESAGVHTEYLQMSKAQTGHAVIQLTPEGQNCIIISSGANDEIQEEYIDEVLKHFSPGDFLLLQNETSNVAYAMRRAKEKGMRIVFNASPVDERMKPYPLELVDYFLINEVEGCILADCEEISQSTYGEIIETVFLKFPHACIVMTVGSDGVIYRDIDKKASHDGYPVKVEDTTAAGDTFCGFFLAGVIQGLSVEECLETATRASAIAVSRKGAAVSIPDWKEVSRLLTTR